MRGVTLDVTTGSGFEFWKSVRDRSVLMRLGLGLVVIGALVVVIRGWKHPFPYRLDERPESGAAARIDFQRVNRERTARAKDRAADQVPLVFRLDVRPLTKLPQELRADLLPFGRAATVSQLPAETRRAFGLTADAATPPAAGVPSIDRDESFARLKLVATDEQKLKDLAEALAKFLQPLERNGLIVADHIPAEGRLSGQIAIAEGDAEIRSVNLSDVQLGPQLAAMGTLQSRWALFPTLMPLRAELERWLLEKSPETLIYDDAATQSARQRARAEEPNVLDVYYAGNLLVKPGELIDDQKLELLLAEYEQMETQVGLKDRAVRVAIVSAMLLVLTILIAYHLVRTERKLVWDFGRLSLYLGMIVLTVGLSRWLSFDPWRAEVGPVVATVMICAIVYNQVLAALTAFVLSLLVTTATGGDIGEFMVLMSSSATAVILLTGVPSRSTLVVVGGWSAATYFLMFWGTSVIENQFGGGLWHDSAQWFQSLRGAGWCLAAGFLISGSLPFIEELFGAVTDISLLELGDVSHPLLQELVRRAPGTYNHSITVASIGETAADAIGANGLLVRVGAYFHDIGKMLKPVYFVENMTGGENKHDQLAPAMSTLIIIGHVKDGADLARQHNLPQPLIDFIEQHHGTTLVEYFYHEAAKQAEEDPDHRTEAEESNFRYPGPKPQTKEAAVLMIADAVEGASRTLSEPIPSRIERLVHDIAMKRLLDGQFDECGLTITELAKVEESLTKSLTAMYHGRVKYPDQKTA